MFADNSAGFFGGAINSASSLVIKNSVFSNNYGYSGGGIFNGGILNNSSLTISGSIFSGNSCHVDGSCITNEGSTTAVDNAFVNNNDSAANGGAIFNYTGSGFGTLINTNNIFSGNTPRDISYF